MEEVSERAHDNEFHDLNRPPSTVTSTLPVAMCVTRLKILINFEPVSTSTLADGKLHAKSLYFTKELSL